MEFQENSTCFNCENFQITLRKVFEFCLIPNQIDFKKSEFLSEEIESRSFQFEFQKNFVFIKSRSQLVQFFLSGIVIRKT